MPFVEHVVIAATGMGTRLGLRKPKCLVEICGKKLIEYQLDLLKNVPNVYMVIGFGEKDVIEQVGSIRKDIIFVRNPDFQHTKTLESYYLAAKLIKGSALFMDGDMILEPMSFSGFLQEASSKESLVGVTKRISDDPVYAEVSSGKEGLMVRDFSYEKKSIYELANIVYAKAADMKSGTTHVFQHLQSMLPLPAAVVDRLEVDTHTDLQLAEQEIAKGIFL